MRSLLFAQMSERCYSQEDIGLIINTPVFQVLLFAIDRTGPRFWFFAFAGLQVTLFALITWATADRYYGGGLDAHYDEGLAVNRRTEISIVILVFNAVIGLREMAQMHAYFKLEIKTYSQIPQYKGWEQWFQSLVVYLFLLISSCITLPAWPFLMIMSRVGSTKALAKGLNPTNNTVSTPWIYSSRSHQSTFLAYSHKHSPSFVYHRHQLPGSNYIRSDLQGH